MSENPTETQPISPEVLHRDRQEALRPLQLRINLTLAMVTAGAGFALWIFSLVWSMSAHETARDAKMEIMSETLKDLRGDLKDQRNDLKDQQRQLYDLNRQRAAMTPPIAPPKVTGS